MESIVLFLSAVIGTALSVPLRFQCPVESGIMIYPNSGCNKFVLCQNSVPDILTCGERYAFDAEEKVCRLKSEVECLEGSGPVHSRRRRQAEEAAENQPYLSEDFYSSDKLYLPEADLYAPAAAPAPAAKPKVKTIKVFQQTDTEGHIDLDQGADTHNDSTVETEVRIHHPSGHGSELAHKTVKHEVNDEKVSYSQVRDFWNKDIIPVKKAVPHRAFSSPFSSAYSAQGSPNRAQELLAELLGIIGTS